MPFLFVAILIAFLAYRYKPIRQALIFLAAQLIAAIEPKQPSKDNQQPKKEDRDTLKTDSSRDGSASHNTKEKSEPLRISVSSEKPVLIAQGKNMKLWPRRKRPPNPHEFIRRLKEQEEAEKQRKKEKQEAEKEKLSQKAANRSAQEHARAENTKPEGIVAPLPAQPQEPIDPIQDHRQKQETVEQLRKVLDASKKSRDEFLLRVQEVLDEKPSHPRSSRDADWVRWDEKHGKIVSERTALDIEVRDALRALNQAESECHSAGEKRYEGTTYTPEDIAAFWETHCDPTARLVRNWTTKKTGTKFGGFPQMPPHLVWPRFGPDDQALHFLAQIDCSEIPRLANTAAFPEQGMLWFFADFTAIDSGSPLDSAVLYDPDYQASGDAVQPPDDLPSIQPYMREPIKKTGHNDPTSFPERMMRFVVLPTMWRDGCISLDEDYKLIQAAHKHEHEMLRSRFCQPNDDTGINNLMPLMNKATSGSLPAKNYDPEGFGGYFPWNNAVAAQLCRWMLQHFRRKLYLRPLYETPPRDLRQLRQRLEALSKTREERAQESGQFKETRRRRRRMFEVLYQTRRLCGQLTNSPPLAQLDGQSIAAFEHILFRTIYLMNDPEQDEDLTDLRKSLNNTLFALKKVSDKKLDLGAALPTAFYDGFFPLTMGRSPTHHMVSGPETNPKPTGGKGAKLLQVDVDYDFGLTGMYLEYWIDPNALSRRDFEDAKLHVGAN